MLYTTVWTLTYKATEGKVVYSYLGHKLSDKCVPLFVSHHIIIYTNYLMKCTPGHGQLILIIIRLDRRTTMS